MEPKYLQHHIFTDFYFSTILNNIDNEVLKRECYCIEESYNTNILSNVDGYQSPDLVCKEQELAGRTEFIKLTQEIQKSLNDLSNYLEVKDLCIDNVWLNINRRGGLNMSHSHPTSLISGVYYVNVESDKVGDFVFERERAVCDYNYSVLFNSNNTENADLFSLTHTVRPQKSLLLLFPSHILHSVRPNTSNTDRISISFNVMLDSR